LEQKYQYLRGFIRTNGLGWTSLEVEMVPDEGTESNPTSGLLPDWNSKDTDFAASFESTLTPQTCRQLFETLAEWGTLLEDHASYLSEEPDLAEPQP
jgi:hypothetical protein